MPRKKSYQWSAADDGEEETRKSRSQKKRESTALQKLGEELAEIPVRDLAKLDMPPQLLDAYKELPRLKSHEARRRQFQFIGRLIREVDDITPLTDALANFRDGLPVVPATATSSVEE